MSTAVKSTSSLRTISRRPGIQPMIDGVPICLKAIPPSFPPKAIINRCAASAWSGAKTISGQRGLHAIAWVGQLIRSSRWVSSLSSVTPVTAAWVAAMWRDLTTQSMPLSRTIAGSYGTDQPLYPNLTQITRELRSCAAGAGRGECGERGRWGPGRLRALARNPTHESTRTHPATRERLKRCFLTSNPPSCYTLARLWG